jgi:hypothetical protein
MTERTSFLDSQRLSTSVNLSLFSPSLFRNLNINASGRFEFCETFFYATKIKLGVEKAHYLFSFLQN